MESERILADLLLPHHLGRVAVPEDFSPRVLDPAVKLTDFADAPPIEVHPVVPSIHIPEADLQLRHLETEFEDTHAAERLPRIGGQTVPECNGALRLSGAHPRIH